MSNLQIAFKKLKDTLSDPVRHWLVRIVCLTLLIQAFSPSPAYLVVGPPQMVQTEHPVTCVHTRLTDEVEEWKIQRSLQLVREMGAPTIVEFFPWAYIESEKSNFNWQHSDQIMRHAQAQGLTVIARLGLVPEWAQPEDQTLDSVLSLNYLEPSHYPDFAAFVGMFVEHYKGQIGHIILWNEPNLAFEWGYQKVEPANYVELLRQTSMAARKANPDIIILAGALAPTLEPEGSSFGMNDLDYLRHLYESGARPYFDALAVHAYGLKFPPDDPPASDVLNFRRVELLREIMVAYGDAQKPIYVTESGWNDHPRWTRAVRPGQRITYTLDSLRWAEAHWPWAKSVCIWALRYPAPLQSYPDYYTLVTPDFSIKPIYYEIQTWARGWASK
jgi:hypothetical protein